MSLSPRTLLAACLLTTGLMAAPALAMSDHLIFPHYSNELLMEADKADMPAVLVFSKKGCPVCAVQDPLLKKLSEESAFKGYTFLQIDFTADEAVNEQYNVTSQSTVIVLDKDGKEISRSRGYVTEEQLRAQLEKKS